MKWNFSFLKRRDKESTENQEKSITKTKKGSCLTEQNVFNSFVDRKRKLVRSTTFTEGQGNTYKGFNSHLYSEEGELLSGDEFFPEGIVKKSCSFDLKNENPPPPKHKSTDSILTVCPNCRTSFDVFPDQGNHSSQSRLSMTKSSSSHYSINFTPSYSQSSVKQTTNSNSMSDSGIFEVLNTSDTSQNFALMDLPEMCNESDTDSISMELPNFSNQPPQNLKHRIKRSQDLMSSNESDSEVESFSGRAKRRRLRKRKELKSSREMNPKPKRQCNATTQSSTDISENSWIQKHVFQTNNFQIPSMMPPPMPKNEFPNYYPPKPFNSINNNISRNKKFPQETYKNKPLTETSVTTRSAIPYPTSYGNFQQFNSKSIIPNSNTINANEKIARERSLEDIRFSLKDQIDKLRRDKFEMEEKFRATQIVASRSSSYTDSRNSTNDYHRELVLRALAVAHQKLDAQLDRLQVSYDSLLAMKYRKMYQDLAIKSTDFTK